MWRWWIGVVLVFLVTGCAAPYGGKCTLVGFGAIPVLTARGSPIVRASVNGHPVAFRVDSGAIISTISKLFADPLGLNMLPGFALMRGVDGSDFMGGGVADDLGLGSARTRDVTFIIGGPGGQTVDGLPVVGLFGEDFLGNYDMVMDLPDQRLDLYRVMNCTSPTPGWSGEVHSVAVRPDDPGPTKIGVRLKVNGAPVVAALDSGAGMTELTMDDARSAGVTRAMLERDPQIMVTGLTNHPVKAYRHRFDSLTIGDVVLRNVVLTVQPDLDFALLGSDFLRWFRVWVPRRGDRMYFQRARDIPHDDPAWVAAHQE